MSRLSIIVAVTENGIIGRDGDMPWRLSSDLKRFKRLTMGHHMIMGRKTYKSIGRPLPGRTSIVLTRNENYEVPEGVLVVDSFDKAIATAGNDDEIFVIGGESIFALAMPITQRLYFTRVHCELEGDTRFPDVDWSEWKAIENESLEADERNSYATTFTVFNRVL